MDSVETVSTGSRALRQINRNNFGKLELEHLEHKTRNFLNVG